MSLDRRVPLAVFLLLLCAYAYINQGWGWNQNSRLDLLHAVFVKHTVQIDAYEENTGDKEKLGDHFYSEKAPGIAALATPAFLLSYAGLSFAHIDIDGTTGWKISEWVTTAGSVGLLAALGGMCVFLSLRRRIGDLAAFASVLAVFIGSLPFPYATMLFSHGGTMGLFAIALWIADVSSKKTAASARWECLLGFVCGFAVAGEYPAAIAAGAFFILVFFRGWKHAVRFVIGAIPPVLLVFAYNYAVSGSPLTLGYSHVDFDQMKEGFFGVTVPRGEALYDILFSQFRGIFFWSPFLLLAVAGYPALYRRSRPFFWITLCVPVAYAFFVSSYAYWDGGFAFGPRHLATAVPFLAIPAAFGLVALPFTGAILAVLSVMLTTFATFVNAMPPNEFHRPLFDFYLSEFGQEKLASNIGRVAGLSPHASMLPWIVIVGIVSIALLWEFFAARASVTYRKWTIPAFPSRLLVMHRLRTAAASLRKSGILAMALCAALFAGLALRFVHLSFMEFKTDEFSVWVSAFQHAHGIAFADVGLQSSLGLYNPPFFTWILSIPAEFTSNPVAGVTFVVAVNVIGMLCLWGFLHRAFSRNVALWTTALLATAPWAIIYSRKFWPQDVMILFLVAFYWSFWRLASRKGAPIHVYVLFLSLTILTQLHLIAWLIPPVLFLFLDFFRIRIRARDALGAFVLCGALYVPYALFHIRTGFVNIIDFADQGNHLLSLPDILEHFSWTIAATSGLKFVVHIGGDALATLTDTYFLLVPSFAFLVYAFGTAGAATACVVDALYRPVSPKRFSPAAITLLFMTAIYAALMAGYIAIGAPPYTQYHIIFYPLAPLLFALGAEKAIRTQCIPAFAVHAVILLIVACNLWFSASFIRFLARNPGVMNEQGYGTPYALDQARWEEQMREAMRP